MVNQYDNSIRPKANSVLFLTGNPAYRTEEEARRFRQLTYTCLENILTRTGETLDFPKRPCKAGIMVNVRFPTCWDGINLDSPDHQSHVAYVCSTKLRTTALSDANQSCSRPAEPLNPTAPVRPRTPSSSHNYSTKSFSLQRSSTTGMTGPQTAASRLCGASAIRTSPTPSITNRLAHDRTFH